VGLKAQYKSTNPVGIALAAETPKKMSSSPTGKFLDQGSFAALDDTLREANRCCNWLSERAWESKIFAQFKLHKIAYRSARTQFPKLNAQCIVRCIAKVTQSYALDKETKRVFRLNGAIAYDLRLLNWYIDKDLVSIWTTSGRLKIPFVCGEKQKELLRFQQGETDLILHKQAFYLASTGTVDNPDPGQVEDFIGCDFGIKTILTDSDGRRYSGAHVNAPNVADCESIAHDSVASPRALAVGY
jgi:putative transposase